MLRIIADRSGSLVRVFHDNVELRGIESIDIHTIEPGKAIKADVTFLDVSVDVKLSDDQVIGVPTQAVDSRGPVTPITGVRPMLVRGKMPLQIDLPPAEALLLKDPNAAAKE